MACKIVGYDSLNHAPFKSKSGDADFDRVFNGMKKDETTTS